MGSLPGIGVLQSCLNSNYVGYIKDESPLNGYIHFRNTLFDPLREQLAFEPSEIAPGYYHIRCVYNNRYWTRKSSAPGSPVIAVSKEQNPKEAAKTPEIEGEVEVEGDGDGNGSGKDKAFGWESTLFKVERYANDIISIKHISTEDYQLSVRNEDGEESCCLLVDKKSSINSNSSSTEDGDDPLLSSCASVLPYVFRIIDLDNYVILPRNLAFKADNDRYYGTYFEDKDPLGGTYYFLEASGQDKTDVACQHQAFYDQLEGVTRIKAKSNNNYWGTGGWGESGSNGKIYSWVTADRSSVPTDWQRSNFAFHAFRVGSNRIVIRFASRSPTIYMSRLTSQTPRGLPANCLGFDHSPGGPTTPIPESIMAVEDLVRQRTVDNVAYRIDDARIYDEQVIHVSRRVYENGDPNGPSSFHTYRFNDRERTVSTWQAYLGLNLGVKTTLRVGIPFLKSAKIEIGAEFEGEYTWGEEKVVETEVHESGTVECPPGTITTVILVASRAKFQIPFSYTQRDINVDWTPEVRELDDGDFIGGAIYDFRVTITRRPYDLVGPTDDTSFRQDTA